MFLNVGYYFEFSSTMILDDFLSDAFLLFSGLLFHHGLPCLLEEFRQ